MNGRFLINRRDAKVMGVAAGIADYTGVDRDGDSARFHRGHAADGPANGLLLPCDGAAGAEPISASSPSTPTEQSA